MKYPNNLDLLRLLAALGVMALHIADLSAQPALAFLHGFDTKIALSVFFIISGHLIFMSCERSNSLADYAVRRVRRIVPAYVVVVVACAVLGVFLSTLPPAEYFGPAWWRYLAANLAFLNFLQPALPGVFTDNPYPGAPVNGALWTIKVEVMFYIAVPMLVALCRRFGHHRVLGAGFLLGCLWWGGFMALAWHTGRAGFAEVAKQMPGQLMFFLPGAWAWYERERLMRHGHRVGVLGVLLLWLAYQGDQMRPTPGVFLYPLALTLCVFWAAYVLRPLGEVARHGDFSYGIYIVHFPVIQTLVQLGVFGAAPLLGMAMSLVITLGLAVLLWRHVEAPALGRRVPAARLSPV
ncbi:MAG: acyltransferase family protein [Aquabacterium sp.]